MGDHTSELQSAKDRAASVSHADLASLDMIRTQPEALRQKLLEWTEIEQQNAAAFGSLLAFAEQIARSKNDKLKTYKRVREAMENEKRTIDAWFKSRQDTLKELQATSKAAFPAVDEKQFDDQDAADHHSDSSSSSHWADSVRIGIPPLKQQQQMMAPMVASGGTRKRLVASADPHVHVDGAPTAKKPRTATTSNSSVNQNPLHRTAVSVKRPAQQQVLHLGHTLQLPLVCTFHRDGYDKAFSFVIAETQRLSTAKPLLHRPSKVYFISQHLPSFWDNPAKPITKHYQVMLLIDWLCTIVPPQQTFASLEDAFEANFGADGRTLRTTLSTASFRDAHRLLHMGRSRFHQELSPYLTRSDVALLPAPNVYDDAKALETLQQLKEKYALAADFFVPDANDWSNPKQNPWFPPITPARATGDKPGVGTWCASPPCAQWLDRENQSIQKDGDGKSKLEQEQEEVMCSGTMPSPPRASAASAASPASPASPRTFTVKAEAQHAPGSPMAAVADEVLLGGLGELLALPDLGLGNSSACSMCVLEPANPLLECHPCGHNPNVCSRCMPMVSSCRVEGCYELVEAVQEKTVPIDFEAALA